MDQKIRFIADYQRDFFSLAELCVRFGVGRKTAYRWIERYEPDAIWAARHRPPRAGL